MYLISTSFTQKWYKTTLIFPAVACTACSTIVWWLLIAAFNSSLFFFYFIFLIYMVGLFQFMCSDIFANKSTDFVTFLSEVVGFCKIALHHLLCLKQNRHGEWRCLSGPLVFTPVRVCRSLDLYLT